MPVNVPSWHTPLISPQRILSQGKEGPQLARTGASQGFPRAAAPVGVFSRGGAPGRPGTPSRPRRGIASPVAIRRGKGAPRKRCRRAAPGKSGLHARGEGERVLALESQEGTRASRLVEEGLSRSLSGGGGKPSLALESREGTRASSFPGGSVIKKNLPVSAGDVDSIPGLGRCPGEGKGNSLQYSCLGNPHG